MILLKRESLPFFTVLTDVRTSTALEPVNIFHLLMFSGNKWLKSESNLASSIFLGTNIDFYFIYLCTYLIDILVKLIIIGSAIKPG